MLSVQAGFQANTRGIIIRVSGVRVPPPALPKTLLRRGFRRFGLQPKRHPGPTGGQQSATHPASTRPPRRLHRVAWLTPMGGRRNQPQNSRRARVERLERRLEVETDERKRDAIKAQLWAFDRRRRRSG